MTTPLQNTAAKFTNYKSTDENHGEVNPTFQEDEGAKAGKVELTHEQKILEDIDEEPKRDQWSNPIEFLLSCIAMSVGLGNVWRFPFTAYENGGGAFLIPYIIILMFVGKPLYYMELCMGQFSSYGSVKVWEMVPAFKGIGYGQAIATWSVVTYYVSLMALTVYYFVVSFYPKLPWAFCSEHEENCFDSTTNTTNKNLSILKPAAEIYYEHQVLNLDPHGLANGIKPPDWQLTLCLLLSWMILYMVLVKGVKSSGKSAYFTALFPYLVLFILLGRGVSLPGALNGIWFFINPKWEKLLEATVWFKAVGQCFFSLSVGFGSIIMFSSYNTFRHNVYRDAAIISIIDTLTSFLAGITVFAILGHLAHLIGVDVDQVLKGGGSGLAFISYPDVIARFDFAPQLFAVLFFLMLFTLGIGSASALTGCIITIIADQFPDLPRYLITLVVCGAGFLLGLFYITPQGQYILDLIDFFGGNFLIYILAFLEVIAVHWIYGMKNFIYDIEFMLKRKTGIYWRFCWSLFIPILLLYIFFDTLATQKSLESGGYVFGSGSLAFGISLAVGALLLIPAFMIRAFLKGYKKNPVFTEAAKEAFQPTILWNPKDPKIMKEYREFLEQKKENRPMLAYQDVVAGSSKKGWIKIKIFCVWFFHVVKDLYYDD